MKTISVTELKANLSKYIRRVRRGGQVQIVHRGVLVAQLTSIGSVADDDARRSRLIRAGVLSPGTGDASSVLDEKPLSVPGAQLGEALNEERGDRV